MWRFFASLVFGQLPRERQQAVFDRSRKRINRLPMPQRAWTMSALATPVPSGGYHDQASRVVNHDDLMAAAKTLGRPALLDLIDDRVQSSGPDPSVARTDFSHSMFPVDRIQSWVLRHATTLLDPADVPRLLAHKPDRHCANRLIAAARLIPQNAESYLKTAFRSFQGRDANSIQNDRSFVCMAMWERLPEKYRKPILNWFFRGPRNAKDEQHGHRQFAGSLGAAKYSGLLLAISNDPRFSTLQWAPRQEIVGSANRIQPNVISHQDTRNARPVLKANDWAKELSPITNVIKQPSTES